MRRQILFALLIPALAVSGVSADEGDGPTFKAVIPTDAVRFVSNLSDDGQASTMIFDNFEIATDVGQPTQPDVRTKTFTYVRRIEADKDADVTQDFRGFVSRDGTASAAMIVHSGGRTTVVDLKKAIEAAKKNAVDRECATRQKAEQAAKEQEFGDNAPERASDDFFVRISTRLPKGQTLQTTVILLVDRVQGDDESGASLVVDSIDESVKAAPPEKKKR